MPEQLSGPSILALVADLDGPALWRVLQPFTALSRQGYKAHWDFKDGRLIGTIAQLYDAYLLPRISWPPEYRKAAQAWFDNAHRLGKIVIYECDDDVFTASETRRRLDLNWAEGKSLERLEQERWERIWALQQCDGVTVSTQRLATIVRTLTDRPVICVPNAIDLTWFRKVVRATKRTVPGLTVGWAGGRRADRDVAEMAEAWGRIAYRFPDVRFVVQGWVPQVIRDNVPEDRLTILPWMKLEVYPSGLAQNDIACCSVADVPFNRAKSPIKCFEGAAAGNAVVASPLLYGAVVDHGFSGFLAESAGEWEDALSELIEKPALRSMMARRLLRTVEKRHSLAGNLWRWPAAWSTIAEDARRRRSGLIVA